MPKTSNYMDNKSCIVMLSGGVKSLACYFHAREKYKKVYPVIICYNQVNSSEIRHAVSWAKAMGDGPRIVSLPHFADYHGQIDFVRGRGPGPLTREGLTNIPLGEKRKGVPGLSALLLSVVAPYAHVLGVKEVITGHWCGPHGDHEDLSSFIDSSEVCINSGISLSDKVSILAPLGFLSLEEVKSFCKPYSYRLSESHSCIHEIDGGCKRCNKCQARAMILG